MQIEVKLIAEGAVFPKKIEGMYNGFELCSIQAGALMPFLGTMPTSKIAIPGQPQQASIAINTVVALMRTGVAIRVEPGYYATLYPVSPNGGFYIANTIFCPQLEFQDVIIYAQYFGQTTLEIKAGMPIARLIIARQEECLVKEVK